jgi:hypothetical protein
MGQIMLNRQSFEKNIGMLLYFNSVDINKDKNNFLYEMIKNDFEDDEFGRICIEICKTEELFNKYPTPKMFYKRRKSTEEQILIEEGVFYLDDTIPAYKPYLNGFSDEDMEKVWKWIYNKKRGEFVSQEWIIERICQFAKQKQSIVEIPTFTEIKRLIKNRG